MPYLNRDECVEYFDYWTRCPRCALVGPVNPDCPKCSGTGRDYRTFSEKESFDGTSISNCSSLVEAVVAFLHQRQYDGSIDEWYQLALDNGYKPAETTESRRPEDTLMEWFRSVFADVLERGMVGADALDGLEKPKTVPSSPEEAVAAIKFNAAIARKAAGQVVCLRRVYLPPESDETDPRDHVLDNEFEPSSVIGEVEWLRGVVMCVRITEIGAAEIYYRGLDESSEEPLKAGDMLVDYYFRWFDCASVADFPVLQEPEEIAWTGRIAPPDIMRDREGRARLFARIEALSSRYGITDGKGYPICENCFYRVETEQFSPVLGCGHHKIAVLASQTCDGFKSSPGGGSIRANKVRFPDVAAMLDQVDGMRIAELTSLRERYGKSPGDSATEERYWKLAAKELEADDLADAVLQRLAPRGEVSRLLNIGPEQVADLYTRFYGVAGALRKRIEGGAEEGVEPYDDAELDMFLQPWMLGVMTFGRCGRHTASAAVSALFHDKLLAGAPDNSEKHALGTLIALMTLEAFVARDIDRNEARTARELGLHFLARAERNVASGVVDAGDVADQMEAVKSLLAEMEQAFGL